MKVTNNGVTHHTVIVGEGRSRPTNTKGTFKPYTKDSVYDARLGFHSPVLKLTRFNPYSDNVIDSQMAQPPLIINSVHRSPTSDLRSRSRGVSTDTLAKSSAQRPRATVLDKCTYGG